MKMNLQTWMVGSLCLCLGFAIACSGISKPVGVAVDSKLASQLYGGVCDQFDGVTTTTEAYAAGLINCNLAPGAPQYDWCTAHWVDGVQIIDCGIAIKPFHKSDIGASHKPSAVLPCANVGCGNGYPSEVVTCSSP